MENRALFHNPHKALFVTAFSFAALLPFFFVNAGTEEYSLPFLMISLYIFTKYYFSPKQGVSFCELIVLGICFACAIMIRLDGFTLWACFCLVVVVESIIKRRFVLLGKYVLGFCLGIIIVFIPIFFYLRTNGITEDFFVQVVSGGTARGFVKSPKDIVKTFYGTMSNGYSFFPLVLGFYWMIINIRKPHFSYYVSYTLSCFMMLLFFSFLSADPHYNLLLIPCFIPALTFLVEMIYSAFSRKYAKNLSLVFLVVLFLFIFSEGLANYFWILAKVFHFNPDTTGTKLINAGKMIDENTKPGDKIISLGYNAYIYPFTKRTSVSKYIYQFNLLKIPGAREDFLSDVLIGKPTVIAIFNDVDGIGEIDRNWHDPVLEFIDNEYRLLSDENGFKLFIRNDS